MSTTVPVVELDEIDIVDEGTLLDGSLRWSLNTVDLRLIGPLDIPELGMTLFIDEPLFNGEVVNVVTAADDRGVILWADVTATNVDEVVASAAPFGLSDDPDDVTTFAYRNLKVIRTRANGEDTLKAELETLVEGFLPGQTVEVTSELEHLDAYDFTIQDVKVGWITDDQAVYALVLGDPIVTMSVWLNSDEAGLVITSTKITDGAVTTPKLAANAVIANVVNVGGSVIIDDDGIELLDEFGGVSLTTEGFSGTWADLLANGLYNALFGQGVIGTVAEGRTSDLPYWDLDEIDFTCVRETDSDYPSGHKLTFTPADSTADADLASDRVPVVPLGWYVGSLVYGYNLEGSSGAFYFGLNIVWYDADGNLISDETEGAFAGPGDVTAGPIEFRSTAFRAPMDARYAVVAAELEQFDGWHASNRLYLGGISLTRVSPLLAGTSFPTSPATRDVFYRSDLKMQFTYDGTRWLSTQLFEAHSGGAEVHASTYVLTLNGSQTGVHRVLLDDLGGSDLYIEDVIVAPFVASGGSALSGSHKWVATANKLSVANAATSLGTISIDSGSSNNWRRGTLAVDAVLGTAAAFPHIRIDWARTGTPGDLNITTGVKVTYRVVAT